MAPNTPRPYGGEQEGKATNQLAGHSTRICYTQEHTVGMLEWFIFILKQQQSIMCMQGNSCLDPPSYSK